MTDKKKYYGLWLGIGLLLCLNLGTIGWIILKAGPFRANRQSPSEMIANRLDFTPRQQDMYLAIHARFLTSIQPYEDSLVLLRTELYGQLNKASISNQQVNALVSHIEWQNGQITRLRFQHLQQARALCTPDQQAQFDRLLARLVQGIPRLRRNQLDK